MLQIDHPLQDPVSRWLRHRTAATFALLLIVASYAAAILGFTVLPTDEQGGPVIEVLHMGSGLLLAALVIPVLETGVFQWLPIRRLGLSSPWAILLSATMFGLSRWPSSSDTLATFLIGLLLAYGFAVRDPINGKPFLLVTIVHAVHNLVASFIT